MLIRHTHMYLQPCLLGLRTDLLETGICIVIEANWAQSGLKLPPGNRQNDGIETI